MNEEMPIEEVYSFVREKVDFIESYYYKNSHILSPLIGGMISFLLGGGLILYEFNILFGICILLIGSILIYQYLRYLLFLHFIKIIKQNNPLLYSKNYQKHDIGKIQEILRKIYSTAKYFQTIKAPQMIDNLTPLDIIREELHFLHLRMNELRRELKGSLTKGISTLTQARSEVEKNITGTTELAQVSELQQARLDRQIEQFEELQRVLVKVS